jgi:hypothetical protein
MAIRGLIITIENYPKARDIVSSLGNTNRAGDAFYDWLVKNKKVAPSNILYCTDDQGPKRTAGTSREEILDQFRDIAVNYRDKTEELYVFFSGHGFSLADQTAKPADVLVTSDFVSRDLSGLACLRLGSLQTKMYYAMGGGHHYYFVDACRNPLNDIEVPEQIGQKWGTSRYDRPCIFTLFSTTRNDKANTSTQFIDSLIAGLRGHGRAKGWVKGNKKKMEVRFELLRSYLHDQLRNPVAGGIEADGACPGVIAELVPPPTSKCSIEVVNPDAGDLFELKITRGVLGPNRKISAPFRIELDFSPEDYDFEVTYLPDPSVPVGRIEPPASDSIDLYEEREVKFQKGLRPPSSGEINSSLTVRGPIGPQLRYIDLHRGVDSSQAISTTSTSREMRTGIHSIELRERGLMLDRRLIYVTPGRNRRVDFLKTLESQPRRENLRTINQRLHPLVAGSLPVTASRNLGLWLSLLGAVHLIPDHFIVGLTRKNSSESTGLAPIRKLSPDQSLLYLLLATEDDAAPQVFIDRKGQKIDLLPVDDLVGVWQGQLSLKPGPAIFSFKAGSQPSSSVTTHLLPNRATFLTVTREQADDFEINQYLLPVYPVIDDLLKTTQPKYLQKIPLSAVRLIWQTQQQFAARHKVVLTEAEDAEYWANPHNAWVDPMMTLIAAYEFIRRGALKRPGVVTAMLPALRAHLDGVPDVEIIAKLAGRRHSVPDSPPIVSDGFAVWQGENLELPMPAEKLSYTGAWTSWRGTIEAQSERASISRSSRTGSQEAGA